MKYLLVAIIALSFSFTSCTKSSSNSNNNNNTGQQNVATNSFYQSTTGQSPINFVTAQAISYKFNNVVTHYAPFNGTVEYNVTHFVADPNNSQDPTDHYKYALRVLTSDMSNYITVNDTNYYLKNFHFVYPSCHEIDGNSGAMEVILTHISASGNATNIGILIQNGAANPAIQSVFDASPLSAANPNGAINQFNPATLLPANFSSYFTYSGSYIFPTALYPVIPYYTPVIWIVPVSPITISTQQFTQYTGIYISPNNRVIQPIGGRTVYLHTQ